MNFRWIMLVGFVGLVVSTSYLLRSEWILGPPLRKRLAKMATVYDAEIEIARLEPSGFFSIALHGVALRVHKEGVAVELYSDTIVLSPGWTESGLDFTSILIRDAHMSAHSAKKTRPKTTKIKALKKGKIKPAKVSKVSTKSRYIRIENLKITHEKLKEDFLLSSMDIEIQGKKITSLKGFGQTPDKIDCILRYNNGAIDVVPLRRTYINKWFRNLPWKISLARFSFCPQCERKAALFDLNLEFQEQKITIDHIDLVKDRKDFELRFGEIAYGEFPARIVDWRLRFNLAQGRSEGRFTISALDGGRIEARWDYDKKLNIRLLANEFELESWTIFNPLKKYGKIHAFSGTLNLSYHPGLQHLDFSTRLKLDEVTLQIDRISSDPVVFPQMGLAGKVLIDFQGRALSINAGEIKLESSDPILLEANAIDANNGIAFEASLHAPRLNALVVRDALPSSMTTVIKDANIDGDFGFHLAVGGHTAFPESLFLDGNIFGDVKVFEDGSLGNINEIREGPLDNIKDWVRTSDLATFVPRTITAAEDVNFYKHPGFDWAGIKRAMVHNIKVGRLERGASTISQQVAKNVFLTRKRTASRKLQEMFLTWRLESELEKDRILEIYLNIASWGRGVRGIGQAAQHYFKVPLSDLSLVEVALLGAILPSPARFGADIDRGQIAHSRVEKIEHVLNNLRFLKTINFAEYRSLWSEVRHGKIGRLELSICNDGVPLTALKGTSPSCKGK